MKAKRILRLSLGGAGLPVLFSILIGLSGFLNASLTHSQMTRIVGGCDWCSGWVPCTTCKPDRAYCFGDNDYVSCKNGGSDPDKDCGYCADYTIDCGIYYQCNDDDCGSCWNTHNECVACNALLEAPPEYEWCG
jgi:hypothetical protein